MKRFVIVFCVAILSASYARAALPPEALPNPQQEVRAVALQKELRCVVCQGESLDESGAPLAADLRHLIRARIVAGDSDDAIKHYLITRYGDFILMKPPLATDTYLLWFGPLGILTVGVSIVAFTVFRARRKVAGVNMSES